MEKLKMLLSLRAWLKSRTLNVAAILGTLSTIDVASGSGWVQYAIDTVGNVLHVMPATSVAILLAVKCVADAVLRAKTDRSLVQK